MKNHNKFIPIAILGGLCILAVSMCNDRCHTGSKTTSEYRSAEVNDKKTEGKAKRTKKDRAHCKQRNCYKK